MKAHWGELLTVLAESVKLYQDLLLLGEEKRQALIGADTAELVAITRREELRILEGQFDCCRDSGPGGVSIWAKGKPMCRSDQSGQPGSQ